MGFKDMVFLAILALLAGVIAWTYLGRRKSGKSRRWQGYKDNGSHMQPTRNDDGQSGGGFD